MKDFRGYKEEQLLCGFPLSTTLWCAFPISVDLVRRPMFLLKFHHYMQLSKATLFGHLLFSLSHRRHNRSPLKRSSWRCIYPTARRSKSTFWRQTRLKMSLRWRRSAAKALCSELDPGRSAWLCYCSSHAESLVKGLAEQLHPEAFWPFPRFIAFHLGFHS